MTDEKSAVVKKIEKVFQDIGGFTWEQAEIWAGFCNAVGMDPMPSLKVMLIDICEVKDTYKRSEVPDNVISPELWIINKGFRTEFKLVEPLISEDS